MAKNLDQALENVEMTYQQLVDIANEITTPLFNCANTTIDEVVTNINNVTADMISKYILDLSTKSYQLSEIKDKAILKQQCAETLREEKYSQELLTIEGKVDEKKSQASLNSSEETLVEMLYTMVASALKTKIDELHRVVDSLKSVLMFKLAEMKQAQTYTVGTPDDVTFIRE